MPCKNIKTASAASVSSPSGASAPPAASERKRKRNPPKGAPKPRVPLKVALRQEGIDEHAIAHGYAQVVGILTKGDPKGHEKLLVDVLDKCSKVLEPPRSTESSGNDVPVIIHLIHDVPRPAYENAIPAVPREIKVPPED